MAFSGSLRLHRETSSLLYHQGARSCEPTALGGRARKEQEDEARLEHQEASPVGALARAGCSARASVHGSGAAVPRPAERHIGMRTLAAGDRDGTAERGARAR